MKLTIGAATAAILVLPLGQVVHAQNADADADPANLATRDENDIVVTARRREETLQDIPLSIQAFDGAASIR